MRSFAILLLATAVLAAPAEKKSEKEVGKRSLYAGDIGISSYGLPYSVGGYSSGLGYGTKILGAGIPLAGSSLASAYASGLEYGGAYKGGIIGSSDVALASLAQPAAFVSSASALPSLAHAKTERITGVTLHREVQVPVPVPQPIPFEVTKHVPVPHPVPYKVDRPVPVPVAQPVPVPVTRHVPVKVDRPYAVPVPHPVEVRVPQPVPVPVAQPVPFPVSVTKHVPVSVPAVAAVAPTFNAVPSTVGFAPSLSAGSVFAAGPALPSGYSSGYSSGISGIAAGHEFVDLGSAPAISSATLSNGIIASGLESGISGVEHFGPGSAFASNAILAPAPFGAGIPFKKW